MFVTIKIFPLIFKIKGFFLNFSHWAHSEVAELQGYSIAHKYKLNLASKQEGTY